jgi:hypothetical protein
MHTKPTEPDQTESLEHPRKLCSTWGNNCIFRWQKRLLGSQFRESLGEKKSLNPEVRETRESEILSPRVSFDSPWVMRKRHSTESSHQVGKTRFTLEKTGENTKKGRQRLQ